MPYFSSDYFNLSSYHCRHSSMFHKTISGIFEKNKDLFQLAYAYNDILFTHAGVESGWLDNVVKCDKTDINDIADTLNSLINDSNGLKKLFCITDQRGGRDRFGSCVWTDVHDIMWDVESLHYPETTLRPIHKIKQVFGHTLQAFYDVNRNIVYDKAVEFDNCKMVDTARAYLLNTDTFEIEVFN